MAGELKLKPEVKQALASSPNIISDIPAHLASAPPARMKGWKGYTDARKWSNRSWINASYEDPGLLAVVMSKAKEADDFKGLVVAKPAMASIRSIMDAKVKEPAVAKGRASYSVLLKSDALQNPNFAVFRHGIMIMASQGNCLESPGRGIAKLSSYATDKTQGPAVAMSSVDATVARRIHIKDCDMMADWLKKYDPKGENFDYQYGYLIPRAGRVQACLDLLNRYGTEILMNIQQVRVDGAGEADNQWITQVPCFAFALGFYDLFAEQRTLEDKANMAALCQKLLELQYQAAAKLAVLKSQQLKIRIPLVLTPVGGGAFFNQLEAIAKAIASIQPIIEGADVDVVVSIFDAKDLGYYQPTIPFLKNSPVITHEEMQKKKSGEVIGRLESTPADVEAAKAQAAPHMNEEKLTPETIFAEVEQTVAQYQKGQPLGEGVFNILPAEMKPIYAQFRKLVSQITDIEEGRRRKNFSDDELNILLWTLKENVTNFPALVAEQQKKHAADVLPFVKTIEKMQQYLERFIKREDIAKLIAEADRKAAELERQLKQRKEETGKKYLHLCEQVSLIKLAISGGKIEPAKLANFADEVIKFSAWLKLPTTVSCLSNEETTGIQEWIDKAAKPLVAQLYKSPEKDDAKAKEQRVTPSSGSKPVDVGAAAKPGSSASSIALPGMASSDNKLDLKRRESVAAEPSGSSAGEPIPRKLSVLSQPQPAKPGNPVGLPATPPVKAHGQLGVLPAPSPAGRGGAALASVDGVAPVALPGMGN